MAITLSSGLAQPPQASVPAEALALRAGQVVEALVVSSGQGGKAQLAIANQVVEAALEARLQAGLLVRLLVQGTGANTRLIVLPSQNGLRGQPPVPVQPAAGQIQGAGASQAPVLATTSPQTATPATTARGQTVSAQAPTATAQYQAQGTAVARTGAQANSATAPVQNAVPAQSTVALPKNVVAVPRTVPANPGGGGAAAPASQANTAAQLPSATGQLQPGTILQLRTEGTGSNVRPVLVQVDQPAAVNRPAQPRTPPVLTALNPLQQAVAQTVQSSVFRQDSISALLTSLAGLGAKLSDLPKPVAQVGAELLAARLEFGAKPLDGAALKLALARSGVLLENTLARPPGPGMQPGDIKSALLKLGDALRLWLGDGVTPKPGTEQRPPPPAPGVTPRAERPTNLPLPPSLSNTETGARLLGQTDAALARMRLTQISSLPDGFARGSQGSAPAPELNMELPLLLGGELGVGQFQILEDGGKKGGREGDGGWKMRFSVNFSQTGEVGATVSLRRRRIGVMLWAERDDMAEILEDMTPELEGMLAARGLEPGSIRCRHGHPPQARRPIGAYMDNSS